jgi:hypothetical protein
MLAIAEILFRPGLTAECVNSLRQLNYISRCNARAYFLVSHNFRWKERQTGQVVKFSGKTIIFFPRLKSALLYNRNRVNTGKGRSTAANNAMVD